MELMAWVLVKVGVAIVKLIPGPLLGIVRDTGGTFYLLLVLVIGILLLVLKVSIRAGTGAQLIKSALIPNDIGLAHLLGWVLGPERILTVVIMALLKVPSYCCWRSFRLSVRDGPRRDGASLVLHPL